MQEVAALARQVCRRRVRRSASWSRCRPRPCRRPLRCGFLLDRLERPDAIRDGGRRATSRRRRLANPLNPAVLRLIAEVVAHGRQAGARSASAAMPAAIPRPSGVARCGTALALGGAARFGRKGRDRPGRPRRRAGAECARDNERVRSRWRRQIRSSNTSASSSGFSDNRPSGTRQRLAGALGKNRSFVSQIANPAYPVPIPVQHLETIFEFATSRRTTGAISSRPTGGPIRDGWRLSTPPR